MNGERGRERRGSEGERADTLEYFLYNFYDMMMVWV